MKSIVFLTFEEVVAIHHDQINRYGGSHGIRDLGLLMSAISRPQVSFAGKDLYPNIFTKAAALMQSLILNHPFVDGNKRTAVVASARSLFVNSYILKSNKKELIAIALNIGVKNWNIEKVSFWLKKNSKKRRKSG